MGASPHEDRRCLMDMREPERIACVDHSVHPTHRLDNSQPWVGGICQCYLMLAAFSKITKLPRTTIHSNIDAPAD